MMETLFIQLGDLMVNIASVNYFRPSKTSAHECYAYFHGDPNSPVMLNVSLEDVQTALAQTYQQMAMMQAAANKAYGSKGSS